jgi:hypothetical protein
MRFHEVRVRDNSCSYLSFSEFALGREISLADDAPQCSHLIGQFSVAMFGDVGWVSASRVACS